MESYGSRLVRSRLLTLLFSVIVLLAAGCDKGTEEEAEGEAEGEAAAPEAPATGGESFELAPGFAQMSLTGRSGGNVEASTHGEDCVGTIASTPDHVMTVTGTVTAALGVTSDADTTLVVLGEGGPYCNDDFEGLNPGLTATFNAGTYQVFVGNYGSDEGPTPYTLTVSPAQPEPPPTPPTTMPVMPPTPEVPVPTPPVPTPPTPPTTAPTGP